MLRAIIICPDPELSDGLEKILAEVGIAAVTRRLDRYPSAVELSRTLRAQAPQVVFLSIVSLEKAQEVVTAVEGYASGIQIVAMNRACDPQTLLEVMRIGIREFVSMPF